MCSRDNPKCELMHISREGWETKRNLPTLNLILKILKYNIKSWKHCQNLGGKEDFEKKKKTRQSTSSFSATFPTLLVFPKLLPTEMKPPPTADSTIKNVTSSCSSFLVFRGRANSYFSSKSSVFFSRDRPQCHAAITD